jgi:Flp pilus assembly protein TadD
MGQGAKPGGAHTELRDADGQPIVSVTSAEPSDRDRTDSAYDMLMRGQYQGALDLYDSVLKSAPANFSALLGRATALHKLRRYGDARIAYRAVLAVDPQNPQALTNMMAIVADGQPDQALSELRDMARQYPSFSPINAAIADIEMRQGDTQGALADYGRAISASPENGLYRLNLAIIQDHAGMKRDAADSYARALQLLASGDSLPVPVAQIQARLRYLQSQ